MISRLEAQRMAYDAVHDPDRILARIDKLVQENAATGGASVDCYVSPDPSVYNKVIRHLTEAGYDLRDLGNNRVFIWFGADE